jgi:hypothetical protein
MEEKKKELYKMLPKVSLKELKWKDVELKEKN